MPRRRDTLMGDGVIATEVGETLLLQSGEPHRAPLFISDCSTCAGALKWRVTP